MPGGSLSRQPRQGNCNESQAERLWPSQSDVLVTARAVSGVQTRAPEKMEGDFLPTTGAKWMRYPHVNFLISLSQTLRRRVKASVQIMSSIWESVQATSRDMLGQ